MQINFSNIPSKIQLHYNFTDNSHTMDATIRNNCERELLAIVKEIASVLELDVIIETEAFVEGGLKELWSFASKNKFAKGVVTGVLIAVLSTYITTDHELNELQKEELRLNIEKLKIELQEKKDEKSKIDLNDSLKVFNRNIKINKHKSNFYKNIYSYEKVIKVGTVLLSSDNKPIDEPKIIERKEFNKFILKTDDLPPEVDENATIEIISPVLKKGRYKWKGIYKDEVIPFTMKDKEFRAHVLSSEIQFKNGTCIDCVLGISRKINDFGDIQKYNYSVITVLRQHDENVSQETPQGRRYRLKRGVKKDQLGLFTKK